MKKLLFGFCFLFAYAVDDVLANCRCPVKSCDSSLISHEKIKVGVVDDENVSGILALMHNMLCECVSQLNSLRSDVKRMQSQVSDLLLINEFARIVQRRGLREPVCITEDVDDIRALVNVEEKRAKVKSIYDAVSPFKRFLNSEYVGDIERYLENTVISPIVEKSLLHIMQRTVHYGDLFDVWGDVRDFTRAHFGYGVRRQGWMQEHVDYFPHRCSREILAAFDAENDRRVIENKRITRENLESRESHERSRELAEQYDRSYFPADRLLHVISNFNKLVHLYNDGPDVVHMDL